MKKNLQKISFIIPCFNEHGGIKKMIDSLTSFLEKRKINYEILVVDDGSKDGTIKIVEDISKKNKKVSIMVRDKKPGFGFSLIDGSKKASGSIIIWVMGDSSDDLKTIPQMIEKIEKGASMVIGSRNVPGSSRGDQNMLKAAGSTVYSRCAKILFRLPVYDITNAFRAFKKELINKVKLENGNFAVSPEFAIKAHAAGYLLAEVPTTYSDRKIGEAKTKLFWMGMIYYKLLIKYWILHLFNRL